MKIAIEEVVEAIEQYRQAAIKEGETRQAYRDAEVAAHMAAVDAVAKRMLMESAVIRLRDGS